MWQLFKNVRISLQVLGLLAEIGRCQESLGLVREALLTYERKLGFAETLPPMIVAGSHSDVGRCQYHLGDYGASLESNRAALEAMRKIPGVVYLGEEASAINRIGICQHKLGNFQEAVLCHQQALQKRRDLRGKKRCNQLEQACSLNNLGNSSRNPAEGLNYHQLSIEMLENLPDKKNAELVLAISLGNLAKAHFCMGQPSKALKIFQKSSLMTTCRLGEKLPFPSLAATLNNIGNVHDRLGRTTEALKFFQQSLRMLQDIYGKEASHPDIAYCLSNIGSCHFSEGNFTKALGHFKQSVKTLRSSLGRELAHRNVVLIIGGVGSAYFALGNYLKALEEAEKSLKMSKELPEGVEEEESGRPNLISSSLRLAGICCLSMGRASKALKIF